MQAMMHKRALAQPGLLGQKIHSRRHTTTLERRAWCSPNVHAGSHPPSCHPCTAMLRPPIVPARRSGYRTVKPSRVATREPETTITTEPAVSPAEPLNWYQQWYPLAIIEDLEPRRPHAVRLLDLPIVLWRGLDGKWVAFEDRCPHRLAPLSEGRVDDDGTLMCSYHGWQFNTQGSCTRIPQIGDPKAAATACSSKRACATAFPVKEHEGLLWVWPDGSSEGTAKAAAAAPAVISELEDEAWQPRTGWFMRDMPLSMDTVVENVVDPCHANFSHHGIQGNRNAEKGTIITTTSPVSASGFTLEQDNGRFKATIEYKAPVYLKYNFPFLGSTMNVYIVPTSRGWCRMITRFVRRKQRDPSTKVPFFFKIIEKIEGIPVLEHVLMRNTVLDGDNYLLHFQERQLAAEGTAGWRDNFYMPGKSDTGVAAWRTWLEKYGDAFPLAVKAVADLPPLMPRQQVLDRYSQHTSSCSHCQKALKRIEVALPVLWAVGAALLLMSALAAVQGVPVLSSQILGCAALAAACGLGHRALNKFKHMFYFVDYVHAEKN